MKSEKEIKDYMKSLKMKSDEYSVQIRCAESLLDESVFKRAKNLIDGKIEALEWVLRK